MADIPLPGQDSIAAQAEMFRRAEMIGLSVAVLAARSPLKLPTLKGWKNGTAMPAWALFALGEAGVPDHILSVVSAPFARAIYTVEDGEGDLDSAAIAASEYVMEHARARHPASPGGIAIVHTERAVLEPLGQRACAAMQRARAAA